MSNNETTENPHTNDVFALLSQSQWRYVTAMAENPAFTKKEAAKYIGLTPDTIYRWPAYVNEAVILARQNIHQAALTMRKQAILKAIAVKIALLDSLDDQVKNKAASDLIEWELGKANQPITGKSGGAIETRNTTINLNAESAHDAGNILKQLAELGAIPPSGREEDNDPATE